MSMSQHGIVDLEHEAAVRVLYQLVPAVFGQINHHTGRGRNCPVHPDAEVLHAIPADTDPTQPRRHHGVGKINDDARRRIQRRDFGRQHARRLKFDLQSVLAVRHLEPLQPSARGRSRTRSVSRGGDQHERQQRNH